MGLMQRDRQRPAYLWMLAGIIALYAAIIILGDSDTGGVVRVALLGFLVWNSARLRTEAGIRRTALALGVVAIVVSILGATLTAARRVDPDAELWVHALWS